MARPTNQEQRYKNTGRKLFDGKDESQVRSKLEEAYLIDATMGEASLFAGISLSALKRYLNDNEEFRTRLTALRNNPTLTARKTVIENLDKPDMALKYLERKAKEEFSTKQEMDVTSKGEQIVAFNYTIPEKS